MWCTAGNLELFKCYAKEIWFWRISERLSVTLKTWSRTVTLNFRGSSQMQLGLRCISGTAFIREHMKKQLFYFWWRPAQQHLIKNRISLGRMLHVLGFHLLCFGRTKSAFLLVSKESNPFGFFEHSLAWRKGNGTDNYLHTFPSILQFKIPTWQWISFSWKKKVQ